MIALPSIAFGGFSGSAKGVTARQVAGRSILSLKCYPTGQATSAQIARRASLKKISKSWALLTDEQRREWDALAKHATGASVFGKAAELSGINLFVRLNANRVMAGEAVLSSAPAGQVAVPNVSYSAVTVTPQLVVFGGIRHESAPYKMVVKMSGSQSAGVSSGWSKTVIISSEVEDDWGEADVTRLYLKTIGVEPVPGQKVFIEAYWLDTSTGFTGQVFKDSVIVSGDASAAGLAKRVKLTLTNTDPEETHVSSFVLDYSTGGPVVQHDAVLLGHSNVASSVVKYPEKLDAALLVRSMCAGRGCGEDGNLKPQSYVVTMYNSWDGTEVSYSHRGGDYRKPTEVFGPGVIYQE